MALQPARLTFLSFHSPLALRKETVINTSDASALDEFKSSIGRFSAGFDSVHITTGAEEAHNESLSVETELVFKIELPGCRKP